MTREDTEALHPDLALPAESPFSATLPATHHVLVFVYRGEVTIGGTLPGESRMGILAGTPACPEPSRKADGLVLISSGPARAILVAGKPLRESVVQHGPFVMNGKEAIFQAIRDFQEGRLGVAG